MTTNSMNNSLHHAHQELIKDLAALEEQMTGARVPFDVDEVRLRLDNMLLDIETEFSLQESNAYVNPILDAVPRLRREARELVNEHQQLEKSFVSIISESRDRLDDSFRAKVRKWIDALRAHEDREIRFFDEVYCYECEC